MCVCLTKNSILCKELSVGHPTGDRIFLHFHKRISVSVPLNRVWGSPITPLWAVGRSHWFDPLGSLLQTHTCIGCVGRQKREVVRTKTKNYINHSGDPLRRHGEGIRSPPVLATRANPWYCTLWNWGIQLYAAIIIIADSGTSCCDVRSSPVPNAGIVNQQVPTPTTENSW